MNPAQPRRRRRRRLLIALSIIVLGLVVYAALPGTNTYTVSSETTYVTDPVDADGRVDYVTALNTRLRGDITPEKNANVFIWQAIGPHPEGSTMPEEYFQWLGRPAPPEDGAYFVRWDRFVKDWAKEPEEEIGRPGRDTTDFHDKRLARAKKWPWAAADEPDLAEWVTKNARPLAALTQASTRPAYYNPLAPRRNADGSNGHLFAYLLSNVQVCRYGANALACRAMLHLKAGRTEESWQDLITCHRLGRLMEKGGTVIEYLLGIAIQLVAVQGETVFLSQAKLSARQLAACRAVLQQLPPPSPVADKVDLAERFILLDEIQAISRDGPGAHASRDGPRLNRKDDPVWDRLFTRSIDWDPAMRLTNTWYDRMAAAVRIAEPRARLREVDAVAQEMQDAGHEAERLWETAHAFPPKRLGELFSKMLLSRETYFLSKLAVAEVRVAQQHRNLTVAFALAAYRADFNKYPATLADLTPKYLSEVPKNIYTNGDLKYQLTATGYRLHSVGPNRIDEDGRDPRGDPRGDDLAIEMPAKEPAGGPE